MSVIDPADEQQQTVVLRALSLSHVAAVRAAARRFTASTILTALRDHLAQQPRVLVLPGEDRTQKWEDAVGDVWQPLYLRTWWVSPGHRNSPGPQEWAEVLARGPLTAAGPADGAW